MASKGKKGSKKSKKNNAQNKNVEAVVVEKEEKTEVTEKKEEEIKAEKIETPEKETQHTEKIIDKTKEESIQEDKQETDSLMEKIDHLEEQKEEKTEEKIKEKEEKQLEETKSLTKQEAFSSTKVENKKKKYYIAIIILVICMVILIFSTIFAILNLQNQNLAKGVKIKDIDVSGLSLEDAKTKVTEALNMELMQQMQVKYQDNYEVEFDTNQIEYTYDIDKALNEAYQIGRNGNIFQNNYCLLFTAFAGNSIDVPYQYNEEFLNNFISDVEAKLPGLVVQATYYIEENELIINKGKDGVIVDKEKLKKNILENIQNRNIEELKQNEQAQIVEIPVIETKADPIDLDKIYQEIHTEPKDAYYELEPFKIYPEVNGIDLEIGLEEAKKQIQNQDQEEYHFQLKITPPQKTIKDLGAEAFPYLISSFSTKYDASNVNRSKNLAIAAGKINGIVLLPGEVFSFNKVVGKRTVEEGYKDAAIYADGGVVDGLAGGICQISSTLYNAVLLANLEIVERKNHSYTTSYVPAGRDATVVYGTIDFQFKNSRTYPIKIEASVSKGIASFKINGIAEENEYEVRILPTTTQSIPYHTQYIQDPSLAPGQQVVVQGGHSGYKVTTYKELKQNGVVVSREVLSNDTYRSMNAVVRIGP